MKRRDTFRLIPLAAAGFAASAGNAIAGARNTSADDLSGMTYVKKISKMLKTVRRTQSEDIIEAAYGLARTIKNKRTVWSNWDQGHTASADIFEGRTGDPGLTTVGYDTKKAKNGDMYMASFPVGGDVLDDLAKKDIFVVGGPAPVSGDCVGAENNIPDVRNSKLRPFSDIWIETGITSVGALVNIPGSPAPLGPASGPLYLTLWWMINADACRILARDGKKRPVKGNAVKLSGDKVKWASLDAPLMDDYFETVLRQMSALESELGEIRKMADMMSDTLIRGNSVYVYSKYRDSLCNEAYHRRGGFGFPKRVHDGAIEGNSGDMVIMGVTNPTDEIDLANLKKFKNMGMRTASIGPVTSGLVLPKGDTVPDNTDIHVGRVYDADGIFAIPGFDRRVCPTSGLMNITALWVISVECALSMIEKTGNTPGIHFSGSLTWGGEHNNQMRRIMEKRGY